VPLLRSLAALSLIVAACASGGGEPNQAPSEGSPSRAVTVVTNAAVYTVEPNEPWAEAFAFDESGVIVALGTRDEVLTAAGADPTVIDAGGNMILPGFQDPHVHVPEAGINQTLCFMAGGPSLNSYETQARACAGQQPEADWVRAVGPWLFDLTWDEELPVDVLDRAVPDRPLLIIDRLGAAVLTNTLGLQAAGLSSHDQDPQGGVLQRDPSTGRFTGLLLENAQHLVRNAAALDDDVVYQGLLSSLDELARNGVTSVTDVGGYWGQSHPAAWQRAADEATLTVRAANALYLYPDLDLNEQLDEFERRFSDNPNSLLRYNTAKIYMDGILDLGTATLLEPYDAPISADYPSGFPYFESAELRTYIAELHAIGYRVAVHSIGDAATREALDAIEAIDDTAAGIAARRHRITHAYLVDEADVPRFAQLGVVADFQVSPDAIDPDYLDFMTEFIGDRAYDMIPTAQLLDSGASVSLSTDWDAGPLSPLGTIEQSLTRSTNAVPDLETAIALTTIDAAYAIGHDDTTGSIKVGKFADFVILDQNLFEVGPDQIGEISVLATYLGGEAVFIAPGFKP